MPSLFYETNEQRLRRHRALQRHPALFNERRPLIRGSLGLCLSIVLTTICSSFAAPTLMIGSGWSC